MGNQSFRTAMYASLTTAHIWIFQRLLNNGILFQMINNVPSRSCLFESVIGRSQYSPPLQGVLCWLCWARYASIISYSPLSRLMGKFMAIEWLHGLIMRKMPATRCFFSSSDILPVNSATNLLSMMPLARSKNNPTISKKPGSLSSLDVV